MIKVLKRNALVSWSLGLFVAYWAFGLIAPGYWLTAFFSAVQLVAGVVVLATALPEAVRIIRQGEIGPGELAVIGVTLLAGGVVYSGGFGLAWSLAGNPPSWLGTVYSTFGRFMTSSGLGLIFLSPDATREGIRPPQWWVVVLGALAVSVIAFALGMQFADTKEAALTVGRGG